MGQSKEPMTGGIGISYPKKFRGIKVTSKMTKVPNFDPTEEQKEQTCIVGCDGTDDWSGGEVWCYPEGKDGPEIHETGLPCRIKAKDSQEAWESMWLLIKQFIRCDQDNTEKGCEGCEYEREEFMSHVYHYGQQIAKERNGTQEAS